MQEVGGSIPPGSTTFAGSPSYESAAMRTAIVAKPEN